MLLRTVTRDRDLAMATLKKHDIPLDKNLKVKSCVLCLLMLKVFIVQY